jgi:hypothetical protein
MGGPCSTNGGEEERVWIIKEKMRKIGRRYQMNA